MQSPLAQKRLAGFDLVQTNYKTVGDHNLRADLIIPQSSYNTGKRPVIIHFHGGGFVSSPLTSPAHSIRSILTSSS